MQKDKFDKRYVMLLLLMSFVLYLVWSFVIPFGQGPDEVQRFDVANFIFKYRQLPVTGDERLIYGAYGVTYASTPYFPHLLSGLVCILFNVIGINVPTYLAARLVSVFSGVTAVYFCFKISERIFKESKLKYFFPIFIMFIPQFAFSAAYVNQDSFTIMLVAIMIYLWLRGIETNWNYKTVIAVGVTCGVVILSYLNGYTIIVATLVVVLITYKNLNTKEFYKKLAICLGLMFLVSGWFFIRNATINNGDFLGLTHSRELAEELAEPGYKPSQRNTLKQQGLGFSDLLTKTGWIQSSFNSFWGTLGNMDKLMPATYYVVMIIISLAAFGGFVSKVKDKLKKGFSTIKKYPLYIGLVSSIVLSFLLDIIYSRNFDYQPQGRYLFPALIPIIILMCVGLREIIPKKYETIVYKVLSLVFVAYNFIALVYVLYMAYYIR